MNYVPPFDRIRQFLAIVAEDGEVRINITYKEFLFIVQQLLHSIEVDEAWYRKTYPDVGLAIDEGKWSSAKDHFVEYGYFEGRMPYDMWVDEAWYEQAYDDVRNGIEKAEIASAKEHFIKHGYAEGRRPAGSRTGFTRLGPQRSAVVPQQQSGVVEPPRRSRASGETLSA